MKYTYLGRTGLKVSRLALGTFNFGWSTEPSAAFAIMDRAVEEGITIFDTADSYGGWRGRGRHGLAEEIIGQWFALGGGRREAVILCTKVYEAVDSPSEGPNADRGVSAYKIKRHIDASLRRLGVDHVDLYQQHHVEEHAPWEELFGAYEDLVRAGKTVYVGSSNFGARHLCWARAAADRRGFLGFVSEQHKYSLACRLPELELLPACAEMGIGVLAWSPLASGLLSGHALDGRGGERSSESGASLGAEGRARLEAYHRLCAELGESPSNVALAWTLTVPAMTAPVIGPRPPEQVAEAARAVDLVLDDDIRRRLDELFPGPGQPAPQAYAW
ncbi:MAG: aldo/keto reductase [Propionibacteriaceae bacterium]|jgi:aryl-alcohol dehydrogenase-like predicted oxidoreductase|nr:aldo/keto reductase [Propionibacteriaceae bacterium]